MPVEKLSNGTWVGIDSEGNSSEFKTRQEARNFASGKYRATKAEEAPIPNTMPEGTSSIGAPVPIRTQIILALESGVFNHSNIKAKNPDTGKVVKMTLGNGNKVYVSGIKVASIQGAIALFSTLSRDIGATVLEWVAR